MLEKGSLRELLKRDLRLTTVCSYPTHERGVGLRPVGVRATIEGLCLHFETLRLSYHLPTVTEREWSECTGSHHPEGHLDPWRIEPREELREPQLIGTNMISDSPPSERVLWPRCAGLVSSTSSTLPGSNWATDPSDVSIS